MLRPSLDPLAGPCCVAALVAFGASSAAHLDRMYVPATWHRCTDSADQPREFDRRTSQFCQAGDARSSPSGGAWR